MACVSEPVGTQAQACRLSQADLNSDTRVVQRAPAVCSCGDETAYQTVKSETDNEQKLYAVCDISSLPASPGHQEAGVAACHLLQLQQAGL